MKGLVSEQEKKGLVSEQEENNPERVKMHFRDILSSMGMPREQFLTLITERSHSPYLQRHRADIIISRVQLIAAVFAVLTPLWMVVDLLAFSGPLLGVLGAARVISTLVFVVLAWPWRTERTKRLAFVMLTVLLLNPPVYYLFSVFIFSGAEMGGFGAIITALYSLLPFIIIAGLSLFPLTALETILYSAPVLAMTAYGAAHSGDFTWEGYVSSIWLLFLIFGIALFSGMSQLRYMIFLVTRVSQDALTGVYTRHSGAEIIDLQFHLSARHKTPFAVAFLDIDDFKSINDNYSHEEGDDALRGVADSLRLEVRRSDVVVRWGGEEFLVVMSNTDCEGARLVIRRIMDDWLGQRPDGRPLTASIGVAERTCDNVADWEQLVGLADARMYEAKKRGKSRCILCNGEELV